MICRNCNKTNDEDSNFCKYCGDNLKPDPSDPDYTIFENRAQPVKTRSELGYLLIALIIAFNTLMWITFSSSVIGGQYSIEILRIFSIFLLLLEFAIMFFFSRKRSYRIIIGIIAAFMLLIQVYYVFFML